MFIVYCYCFIINYIKREMFASTYINLTWNNCVNNQFDMVTHNKEIKGIISIDNKKWNIKWIDYVPQAESTLNVYYSYQHLTGSLEKDIDTQQETSWTPVVVRSFKGIDNETISGNIELPKIRLKGNTNSIEIVPNSFYKDWHASNLDNSM